MKTGTPGQIVRLKELDRRPVTFRLDGRKVEALEGDTVLVAMLVNGHRLRISEFGGDPRAGFCMMAACQDCWVDTAAGERFRACSTAIADGMDLLTERKDNA